MRRTKTNNFFQFQKFKVAHDKCAMKVGTDGVLLGAWTSIKNINSPINRVLDIGSGSGLISLMLAQRITECYHNKFFVHAVEIEKNAAQQCQENFKISPWSEKLIVRNVDINNLETKKFDLIVSNPPFFDNCVSCIDDSRDMARRENTLSRRSLVANVKRLLSNHGHFSLVIPASDEGRTIGICWEYGLFLCRKCIVYGKDNKNDALRVLLDFSFFRSKIEHSKLILRGKDNLETSEYRNLIKEFML